MGVELGQSPQSGGVAILGDTFKCTSAGIHTLFVLEQLRPINMLALQICAQLGIISQARVATPRPLAIESGGLRAGGGAAVLVARRTVCQSVSTAMYMKIQFSRGFH